ncbi:MAG: IS3 family transposase, partial [Calditrichota bacterium]
SMGRVGNCYDNAMMESFFSTLKRELLLNESVFSNRNEAYKAIGNYIDNYYNRTRIHSSIGNMSPVQFEQTSLLT